MSTNKKIEEAFERYRMLRAWLALNEYRIIKDKTIKGDNNMFNMIDGTITLTNAKFYKDGQNGFYYADLTYRYENDSCVTEINFPKAHIPLPISEFGVEMDYSGFRLLAGNNEYPLEQDEHGREIIERVIEEKPKKMTIEEIEKKLGHKVEIVSGT